MTFKLHNTLTRKKEVFKPIDQKNVRMYVCGPTVYDYAHIGNARPVVVFDMLFRLLRHLYGEDHVTYARNITDIDDKIMKAAVDGNKSIKEISDHFAKIYSEDAANLNALEPTTTPRATDYLPEMKAMIEKLIADGHAYEAEGHVLFNVPSMATYGRLSNKDQDELIAGARVEVAPYKKDPRDFVLWKPSSEDQPGWDSPWGRGRPGWHLECSCMTEDLAETIDIHGGGLDLIFPHHENEIAQSECAHGKPMANYWVHNGYLVLGGEKMSKSLGNIKTIHGLLENHRGEALRLTLLSAHYRQPLDFSEDAVREQKARLDRWYRKTESAKPGNVPEVVLEALKDDLNTPKAIAAIGNTENPAD
ncbi:MAG: cysteine--tRNA ligase, partial [Sphingomonadales bacterium]